MVVATIVANLIGGCIFFWVDKWIFGDKRVKKTMGEDAEENVEEFAPAVVAEWWMMKDMKTI